MKKNLKKALALFVAVVMMLSAMPVVLASEGETPVWTNTKGELKTTTDGAFSYYEYVITTIGGDEYFGPVEYDQDVYSPGKYGTSVTKTVSHVVEIAVYLSENPRVVIPAQFDNQTDPKAYVRIIGDNAFFDRSDIKGIEFPNTMEVIGNYAFNNCSGLTEMTFRLPDSVKKIGDHAFHGCTGLTIFRLPTSLEYIGSGAFHGCTNFIGNATKEGMAVANPNGRYDNQISLIIPQNVTHIGDGAFEECKSIISVIVDCGVTEIYTGTFTGCSALERVEFGKNVKYVGAALNAAFTDHNQLDIYEPALVINNPHCVIEESPEMDDHVVVYGGRYSTANSFADNGYVAGLGELAHRVPFKFVAITIEGHEYVGTVTAPDCLKGGYTTYTCACGEGDDSYITEYTDPLGHDYEKEQIFDAETLENYCGKGDLFLCTCKRCGYQRYELNNLRAHTYETRCSATCDKAGATYSYCTVCGHTADFSDTKAYGHKWAPVDEHYSGAHEVDGVAVVSYCANGCGAYRTVKDVCKCNCHRKDENGIREFIYKIQIFIWKLFRIAEFCECGIAHY